MTRPKLNGGILKDTTMNNKIASEIMGAQPIVVFAAALNWLKVDFFLCAQQMDWFDLFNMRAKHKRATCNLLALSSEKARETQYCCRESDCFLACLIHTIICRADTCQESPVSDLCSHIDTHLWLTEHNHNLLQLSLSTVCRGREKNPPRIMLSQWDFFF